MRPRGPIDQAFARAFHRGDGLTVRTSSDFMEWGDLVGASSCFRLDRIFEGSMDPCYRVVCSPVSSIYELRIQVPDAGWKPYSRCVYKTCLTVAFVFASPLDLYKQLLLQVNPFVRSSSQQRDWSLSESSFYSRSLRPIDFVYSNTLLISNLQSR